MVDFFVNAIHQIKQMELSVAISILSLAVSIIAVLYNRKKVVLDKLRYAEAKERQLGRSVSFDILHIEKVGQLMDSPDNPWDSYELKQIVACIAFTNNSECPIWLKTLNVGIIVVSTLAYHSNPLVRMYGALYPVRWGLQMALPFRFSDYRPTTFITTFPAGKRLGTPSFSLRFSPELKARISRAEKVIEGIILTNERDGKPVSSADWLEISPGDTKSWAVSLQITDLGATWFRKSRLKLSKLYMSLEFNTCSVDAHAKIPLYYWREPLTSPAPKPS